jgi:hypothetical protein
MTEDDRIPKIFPDDIVLTKIYLIRDNKVMIDKDLAELYGIETKRLKEAVRRNRKRFPEDFMFEMSKEELENWRTQFATSNSERMGLRYPPFCFTEQGVTMLSCVLNSERAIHVNIQIVRVFSRTRELLITNKDILQKLMNLESKGIEHDKKIKLIFEYLQQLSNSESERKVFNKRPRIGFKK